MISAMRLRSSAGRSLQRLEAGPGDVLGHEHALAREGADDVGDEDERVAAVEPRDRALVRRLELVVELLADPRRGPRGDRLDVELGREAPHQAHEHAEVLQVGADRRRDARVLDLDGDLAAVVQRRAVDLADRGGGDRLGVELGEDLLERLVAAPLRSPCASPRRRPVGAASRSSASLRWNSSRYSSSTKPTSRNESTWPSFIAAPFIVPRTATICSAVSTWRRASASWLASSPRATFAARVARRSAACLAARRPIVAERAGARSGCPRGASRGGSVRFADALDARAGDDVVAAVRPAHPGLVAAVVVVGQAGSASPGRQARRRAPRPRGRGRARCG